MRTKIKILIFLAISFFANGQEKIHFEQIAFEFYKDSILNVKEFKKDITISQKIVEDAAYWNVDCLKEFNLRIDDTAASRKSKVGETIDLNLKNENKFKIVEYKSKKPPVIFATKFMSFDPDKNIIGIVENNRGKMTTYLFEINQEGEIKKWCKGKFKRQ